MTTEALIANCPQITDNMYMLLGKVRRGALLGLVACFMAVVVYSDVDAQQSTNYRFEETAIGTNSLLESGSTNFQIQSATGDLSVGNAASTNYQIETGTQTTNDPNLSFALVDASAGFGSFSSTAAATATASFVVTNYTSYGYIVQVEGAPPSNGSHQIDPILTSDTSQVGTEQFGINLVANTSPSSVGSNPDNGISGFGEIATGYDTPNQYQFNSGDTIAQAPKSSGETIYTITYLVNVEALTPGGQYSSNQTLVVVGTY